MPIYKALPQSSKEVIDLRNKISTLLNINIENIHVFFGFSFDPDHLMIKFQENIKSQGPISRPIKETFDFQKLIELQNTLNIKIELFRIYNDKTVLFWSKFIRQLELPI